MAETKRKVRDLSKHLLDVFLRRLPELVVALSTGVSAPAYNAWFGAHFTADYAVNPFSPMPYVIIVPLDCASLFARLEESVSHTSALHIGSFSARTAEALSVFRSLLHYDPDDDLLRDARGEAYAYLERRLAAEYPTYVVDYRTGERGETTALRAIFFKERPRDPSQSRMPYMGLGTYDDRDQTWSYNHTRKALSGDMEAPFLFEFDYTTFRARLGVLIADLARRAFRGELSVPPVLPDYAPAPAPVVPTPIPARKRKRTPASGDPPRPAGRPRGDGQPAQNIHPVLTRPEDGALFVTWSLPNARPKGRPRDPNSARSQQKRRRAERAAALAATDSCPMSSPVGVPGSVPRDAAMSAATQPATLVSSPVANFDLSEAYKTPFVAMGEFLDALVKLKRGESMSERERQGMDDAMILLQTSGMSQTQLKAISNLDVTQIAYLNTTMTLRVLADPTSEINDFDIVAFVVDELNQMLHADWMKMQNTDTRTGDGFSSDLGLTTRPESNGADNAATDNNTAPTHSSDNTTGAPVATDDNYIDGNYIDSDTQNPLFTSFGSGPFSPLPGVSDGPDNDLFTSLYDPMEFGRRLHARGPRVTQDDD